MKQLLDRCFKIILCFLWVLLLEESTKPRTIYIYIYFFTCSQGWLSVVFYVCEEGGRGRGEGFVEIILLSTVHTTAINLLGHLLYIDSHRVSSANFRSFYVGSAYITSTMLKKI